MTAMAHRVGTWSQAGSSTWRGFFWLAAAYDMALGIGFFLFWEPLFRWLGMVPPGDVAYIQISAVFVFVQGVSYALVAVDPPGNPGLVRVGVAYKAAYTALAVGYLLTDALPSVFFAWFGLFDFVFMLAFLWFLRVLAREEGTR